MGGLLTIHAREAEAQKHKAENNSSNFTHFKHAHMIFRPCKRIFLSLWIIQRYYYNASPVSPDYPSLFAFPANFIYKKLCAPAKTDGTLCQHLCFCQEFYEVR
jgi:hypothetical protein